MPRRLDLIYRLRLDAGTRAALNAAAAVAGCSVAAFVRRAAHQPACDSGRAALAEIVALRRLLNGAANNLNQSTRLAHSGQLDATAIEAAATAVADMREAVVSALDTLRR